MVPPNRTCRRQNHGILNLFVFHHLFDSGEQISFELKAQNSFSLELGVNSVALQTSRVAGFCVIGGVVRGVVDLSAGFLEKQNTKANNRKTPRLTPIPPS